MFPLDDEIIQIIFLNLSKIPQKTLLTITKSTPQSIKFGATTIISLEGLQAEAGPAGHDEGTRH